MVDHQRGGLQSAIAYHCVTGCLNLELYEVDGKWVNDKVHSYYNYSKMHEVDLIIIRTRTI